MKNRVMLTVLGVAALGIFQDVRADEQLPDMLVFQGKTYFITWPGEKVAFPLEPLLKANPKIAGSIQTAFRRLQSPACGRGYLATWEVRQDVLHLKKLMDPFGGKTADLKAVFPIRVSDGRVKADWFTGEVGIVWKDKKGRLGRKTILVFKNGKLQWPSVESLISKKANKNLTSLKAFLKTAYTQEVSGMDKDRAKAWEDYKCLVTQLGKSISSKEFSRLPEASPGLEQSLCEMACLIQKYPKRYTELLEYYKQPVYPEGIRPHVIRPAKLHEKHCTETYRAGWEFLLLAPPTDPVLFLHARGGLGHVYGALSEIHDPRSLPILLESIQMCVSEGRREALFSWRPFRAMAYFRSYEGLRTILKGLDIVRDPKTGKMPVESGKTFSEWVMLYLLNEDEFSPKPPEYLWPKVIAEYPTEGLSGWQKTFLKEVLERINEKDKTRQP